MILFLKPFLGAEGDRAKMKNPYQHEPFCQTSSAIAASCPACQWALLHQSQPLPEWIFEKKLTQEDEMFLTEMLISL